MSTLYEVNVFAKWILLLAAAGLLLSGCEEEKVKTASETVEDSPSDTDTDGDGLLDSLEQTIGTSPRLTDTDGDGLTDFEEHTGGGFNPLIADLSKVVITLTDQPSIQLDIKDSSTQSTVGSHTANYEKGSSTSYSRSDTEATSASISATASISNEVEAHADVSTTGASAGGSNKTTVSASTTASFSRDESTTVTSASATSMKQAYADFEQAGYDTSTTTESGSITATLRLQNDSDLSFDLYVVEIIAKIRTEGGTNLVPVGTLRFDATSNGSPFTLGPSNTIEKLVSTDSPSVPVLKNLLRNPSGLVFSVANYELTDRLGRKFANLSQDTLARTAQVVIDYGPNAIDSNGTTSVSYLVAANVRRDSTTDALLGVTMKSVMDDILKLTYQTAQLDILDGSGQPTGATYQVLAAVDHPTDGMLGVVEDASVPPVPIAFWYVFGNSDSLDDSTVNFDDIVLMPRDRITLVYMKDQDRDRLSDREEFLLGTNATNADTDGDTLSDFDEVKTGWTVVLPTKSYLVYSDPTVADADGDTLNDNLELAQGTDPNKPDTDGDGISDLTDSDLGTNPVSLSNLVAERRASEIYITGTISALTNLASVVIDWGDATAPLTLTPTLNPFALSISHSYAAAGTYTVMLTASDDQAPNTAVQQFTVGWKPDISHTSGFHYDLGWRVQSHPRTLADVNGDGKDDLVGFGASGVDVALAKTDGTGFDAASPWVDNFGTVAGQGWTLTSHIRTLADVDNDGNDDVVGFGTGGVLVALSNGVDGFGTPTVWSTNFGTSDGYSSPVSHPRFLADVNGDGLLDVVAFKDKTYVALNQGGGFGTTTLANDHYGTGSGWNSNNPRQLADIDGDGILDILGYGNLGISISLGVGNGTFVPFDINTDVAVTNFGYNQGWRVAEHPRILADVDGDGKLDVVGFGAGAVYVSLNLSTPGTVSFAPLSTWSTDFATNSGWRTDYSVNRYNGTDFHQFTVHPRMLADMNGDGMADIVAITSATVVALSNGAGFDPAKTWSTDFNSTVWREPVQEVDTYDSLCIIFSFPNNPSCLENRDRYYRYYPRMIGDTNGDGAPDIVGFGKNEVRVLPGTSITSP